MKIQWNKRVLALCVLLSMASVVGAVVYNRSFQQEPKVNQPAVVKEAPPVASNIERLQITGVRLVNQGTAQAAIEIDVTNNRDSAVMALDFIWRHDRDTGGVAIDGLLEEDNPRVVIPPHSLKTFTLSLGEIPQGKTVFLGSAIFADGKEEGDQRSLKGIKSDRIQHQLKRKAQKENGGRQ
jgi:hypothetical protein